ncbi:ammonium transporter [Desarmillaria tabescens]|uniref:Ammonium transporter n=1 Tax=Armillaria tabescens TaxID=1929756 RepID=A0AA39ML53_ARMTA|nr:ammonium transporter [Desarmillaria tabescens]KAK0437450.1 ammonium transporter [Desarmillaria tabescens]
MVNVTYDASGTLTTTDADGVVNVYNNGDIAWTLASTALVWIMIPGVGYLYSGLLRRKNALGQIYMSVMVLAVVSFQWFFWGYSLAFSETGSKYIGDLKYFGLKGVLDAPSMGSVRIPALVFCVYQLMFAAITPMLAVGALAERGRLGPVPIFVFVWSTIVYDPIACWTWSANGWSFIMGGLDFAGGTPVHISSGTAALAISIYLGKRKGWGTERLSYKPHNTSYIILGTVLLWFGWFGFNGGSALSANLRAAQACIVTNLAASVGGLTWMLWDYRLEKKWSAVGFCSGAISGLVAITPASGFVGAPASVLFGVMAGTCCNFATQLKFVFGYDDTLDIFASHGIGGIVGNILTGLFAQASVAGFDGITVINGGWIDHHYIQLGYQLADSVSGVAYSFTMTTIILWIMHFIPGCRLRLNEDVSEEAQAVGMDDYDMGEFAYDYVGLEQELAGEDKDALGVTTGGREPYHHVHQHHHDSGSSSVEEKKEVATITPA